MNTPAAGTIQVVPPFPAGVTSVAMDVQKDQIEGAELRRRLLADPLDFVRKLGIQLVTFWYLVVDRTQSLVLGGIVLLMLALASVGVRAAQRQGASVWPVLAIVVYLNLVYAATLAMARYSMPLYGTLAVLVAGGLAALASRRSVHRRRLSP
jgi:hypothetical protein